MMDIFDPHYDVDMRKLIFPEYNKNQFFDGQMVFVLDGDYRYNIIWGRYFNTWWIMIKNNNVWMEYERYIIVLPMICVMVYIPYAWYKEWKFMLEQIYTIWYYHICLVMPCKLYKEWYKERQYMLDWTKKLRVYIQCSSTSIIFMRIQVYKYEKCSIELSYY